MGYSGINVTGGGGGVRPIFLGLKFSTPVFFWLEDLIVYRVFAWVSKICAYFFGSKMSSLVFFLGAQCTI